MAKTNHRRLATWTIIVLALIAGLAFAFWPRALAVDLGTVSAGPMAMTVNDEGETRVVDVFTESAPVSGRLRRIEAEPGDAVFAGSSVVAELEPTESQLLDPRSEAEAQAQLSAAVSSASLAEAELTKVEAELKFAQSELERARELALQGTIPKRELEAAERAFETTRASLGVTQANMQVRRFELQRVQSRLMSPDEMATQRENCVCIMISSPVDGQVLRVLRESEGFVRAGDSLIEIGNPERLEIMVDLLSTEAVKVSPGDEAIIENWGGGTSLAARVRRIEPFGFTKTSALGIDEKRVNVVLDLVSPRDQWQALGHGYQVDVRIVLWRADRTVKVPLTALFQDDGDWALFIEEQGRAVKRAVKVGAMNEDEAQIESGLAEGERFVIYPGIALEEGIRLAAR
jgi:HlyD family secretion protein